MNIVHFIPSLERGGAEKQVISICKELAKKDHQVSIFTIFKPTINSLDVPENIKVYSSDLKNFHISFIIAIFKIFSFFIFNRKIDVVHSHMSHCIIISRLLSILNNYRVIETFHCIPAEIKKVHIPILRVTRRASHYTTVVSKRMGRWLKDNRCAVKVLYIPNGVDDQFLNHENFPSPDIHKWISVGRLIDKKGYLELLDIVPSIIKSFPEFSLHIFGDGPLKNEIERKILKLGLKENVFLCGTVNDIHIRLIEYNGFVSASKIESFGIVILEALVSNLIVCSTDCDGPKEILTEEIGFLSEVGDYDGIKNNIIEAMSLSKESSKRMKNLGRKRVLEKFTFPIIVLKWIDIYSSR
ncbi:glycosyltransferase [Vibrio breoganii]